MRIRGDQERWHQSLGLMLVFGILLAACSEESTNQLPVTVLVIAQPCDVRVGCVAEVDDFSMALSMGPEMRALTPFPVNIEVQRGQSIASMTVAFGMQGMDMGLNRYGFIKNQASTWHANVTLPVCISGRSDWIADFEILADGKRYQFQVPFALEK